MPPTEVVVGAGVAAALVLVAFSVTGSAVEDGADDEPGRVKDGRPVSEGGGGRTPVPEGLPLGLVWVRVWKPEAPVWKPVGRVPLLRGKGADGEKVPMGVSVETPVALSP